MHDYDRSSKWIIQHHGDALLRLAGLAEIRAWRPLQAEVVQPRQLPDGLLEVEGLPGEQPDLFLIELATWLEPRLIEQLTRDVLLVFLDRRILPEAIAFVLHPGKGRNVQPQRSETSRLLWTRLEIGWRIVPLWTLQADDLFAADDVGMVPWIPLTQTQEPPEAIASRCRDAIDRLAPRDERANLLAVTAVMARLRYNDPRFLSILGGSDVMIESVLIQEIVAERMQKAILRILKTRFSQIPADLPPRLSRVLDEEKLSELSVQAAVCPDFAAFDAALEQVSP